MNIRYEKYKCPTCGEEQVSLLDNAYFKIFEICWHCDWLKWKNGILSLEEFEVREHIALEYADDE